MGDDRPGFYSFTATTNDPDTPLQRWAARATTRGEPSRPSASLPPMTGLAASVDDLTASVRAAERERCAAMLEAEAGRYEQFGEDWRPGWFGAFGAAARMIRAMGDRP